MIYEIIKDFRGSQDGRFAEEFKAGTQAEISDYLAPHVARWVRPVIENKAVITDGKRQVRRKERNDSA